MNRWSAVLRARELVQLDFFCAAPDWAREEVEWIASRRHEGELDSIALETYVPFTWGEFEQRKFDNASRVIERTHRRCMKDLDADRAPAPIRGRKHGRKLTTKQLEDRAKAAARKTGKGGKSK